MSKWAKATYQPRTQNPRVVGMIFEYDTPEQLEDLIRENLLCHWCKVELSQGMEPDVWHTSCLCEWDIELFDSHPDEPPMTGYVATVDIDWGKGDNRGSQEEPKS